ncbi:hypothetical protein L3X38_000019 [Prunus dulcis]|uniref:Uncharacterized protein n=1 Tax=Prunus dulcis TaxID=3755 RepID=A0AAD4UT06_PRUDU|nr:hypothetical protein L3X38_000019 [Prunus dulcis]
MRTILRYLRVSITKAELFLYFTTLHHWTRIHIHLHLRLKIFLLISNYRSLGHYFSRQEQEHKGCRINAASEMQSATFTLSHSLRLPKPLRQLSATLNPIFDSIHNFTPLTNGNLCFWSLSSSSSNFKLKPWTSVPLVDSDAGTSCFQVRATAESAEESSESGSMNKTLELGALFGL